MNGLVKLTAWVIDFASAGPYSKIPYKKLFYSGGTLVLWWVILLSFTYTWSSIVTIPLSLLLAYFYYLYCIIWRAYKLPKLYLIICPIAGVILSVVVKYAIHIFVF